MTDILTLRLDERTSRKLQSALKRMKISKSEFVREAISQKLEELDFSADKYKMVISLVKSNAFQVDENEIENYRQSKAKYLKEKHL